MSNRSPHPRDAVRQAVLPDLGPPPNTVAAATGGQRQELWVDRLRLALAERSAQARGIAEDALRAMPPSPELLLLAALAALAEGQPERALGLLKRYGKRYGPGKPAILLTGLALAQQGHSARAWAMLREAGLHTGRSALSWFVGDDVMEEWLYVQLHALKGQQPRPSGRLPTPVPSQPSTSTAPSPLPSRPAKPGSVQAPTVRPPPARVPKLGLTRLGGRFADLGTMSCS